MAATRFYKSPGGRLFCQFIAEGQSDPDLLALFRERFLHPRRKAVREMWERGVARGEIRPELDPELVIDLIFGPMVYRLLVGHGPLDDADAEAMVAAVFRGLQVAPGREPTRKRFTFATGKENTMTERELGRSGRVVLESASVAWE